MTKYFFLPSSIISILLFCFCETEIRNIAVPSNPEPIPTSAEVNPVNINEQGFEFLEQMQGHWVGINRVIAQDFDWFAFDYRAISPSHIHGIFEGGTMGNLLTSFFVTNFKGTRTIMARNGGVLNGIYRTSYFVMDSVRNDGDEGNFYRLVDAEGGTNTMWMELRFVKDSLYFNAYTSRLGLTLPSRHMTFKGKKEHIELAQAAATAVGFPKNEVAWDFSEGFNQDHLYAEPGAKSATFLAYDEDAKKDVFTLAQEAGDPFVIDQHPYLAYLQIDIVRNNKIRNKTLWIYLSKEPLTTEEGYFYDYDVFDTVLLFPELVDDQNQFLVTYLHPGDYYVNITADVDGDGQISTGDYTHPLESITIEAEGQHQITIRNINVEN